MRYISIFSGIEAASVAWEPLGWEPVAFSEIDPFPCAVLKERFPNVPNLGDVSLVDWSEYRGSVDVVVGWSPCQSFSIAGKREGLQGESGLMFEYIRCVREVMPRYFVWENVPGALSSEKGAAFGQLLSEMDGLGYGLAWRVLDAQFFGVAQRRRRVFLVGSLGDQRAAEILFEPDSLRWDHPSSREKRQELTRAAQQRSEEGGGSVAYGMSYRAGAKVQAYPVSEDLHPTLLATRHDESAVIPINTMVATRHNKLGRGTGFGVGEDGDAAYTISTAHCHAACMASGQANAEIEYDMAPAQAARQHKDPQIVCMADYNANAAVDADMCGSLKVGGGEAVRSVSSSGEDVVGALCARDCKGVGSQYVGEGKVIAQWRKRAKERFSC